MAHFVQHQEVLAIETSVPPPLLRCWSGPSGDERPKPLTAEALLAAAAALKARGMH